MTTDFSPSQLIHFAERGMLGKTQMANLLPDESRERFLAACSEVEKAFARACAAHGEEVWLKALLNANPSYNKACGELWLPLFKSSQHAV